MHSAKIEQEVTIATPIEKVFGFLTKPGKVQTVLPGLIETMNVPAEQIKAGDSFDYRYQMFGVMLEGKWFVKQLQAPKYYEASTDGAVSSSWRYTLNSTGRETKVKLEVEYDPPKNVLQKAKQNIIAALNEKEIEQYLFNLKTVLELQ